jgi:hypothetical protein
VTQRHPHAQGRHQRGDPRLGHERAHHLLHHRLGRRAAPVPDDGARLPERDRRETMDQLEALEGRRAPDLAVACVGGGSNAIGLFAPYAYLPAAERPRLVGVEAAGHGSRAAPTPPASAPAAAACSTARSCTCSTTTTARSRRPTASRPASTTRASAPSTATTTTRASRVRRRRRPRRARRVPAGRGARGHHPGARDRARLRLRARGGAQDGADAGDRRQPLRPRRQGRRRGRARRGGPGRRGGGVTAIAALRGRRRPRERARARRLRRRPRRRPRGVRAVPHGRLPRRRARARGRRRARCATPTCSRSGSRTAIRSATARPSSAPPRRRSPPAPPPPHLRPGARLPRGSDVPIALMTYYNPVYATAGPPARGEAAFVRDAARPASTP